MPRLRTHLRILTVGLAAVLVTFAGTVAARGAGPAVTAAAHAARPAMPHQEKVLVVKYFPLTSDGQNIDVAVTGDVDGSLTSLRAQTTTMTANIATALTDGTRYHGYADTGAQPSLTYQIIDTKEYLTAVPTIPNPTYSPPADLYKVRPDYTGVAAGVNICDYVQNQGVDEVWMWAYQGPSQLAINESKMAGPHGDQSNSSVKGDLPACTRTYTWYTFNYGRGTAEAVHSHSHQLEVELNYLDRHTFTDLFEGTPYAGNTTTAGRCGSVHNPPNATSEYDWGNPTPHPSDCPNWMASSTSGPLTSISCATWTCTNSGDTDNAQLNYLVWWMQNFPGAGNHVTLGGRPMRNWWEVHADFDAAVDSGTGLVEPPTSSPGPSTTPIPTASTDLPQYSFEDGTLSGWAKAGHITTFINSTTVGGQNATHALQLVEYASGNSDLPYIHVSPANGPTAGQTLTAYLYRPGGGSATLSAKLFVQPSGNSGWLQGNLITITAKDTWVALHFTLPSFTGHAPLLGVQFAISPSNTNATVYLDSVSWN